jgi:hypothetical protein
MAGGVGLPRADLAMPGACGRLSAVSLLTELDAFYTEHRRCGELEVGVEKFETVSQRVVRMVWRARPG